MLLGLTGTFFSVPSPFLESGPQDFQSAKVELGVAVEVVEALEVEILGETTKFEELRKGGSHVAAQWILLVVIALNECEIPG